VVALSRVSDDTFLIGWAPNNVVFRVFIPTATPVTEVLVGEGAKTLGLSNEMLE